MMFQNIFYYNFSIYIYLSNVLNKEFPLYYQQ